MKGQTKAAIALAIFGAVGAAGVIHMTGLPKPGTTATPTPKVEELPYEMRYRIERLAESVRFQCEDIGRRTSRFNAREGDLIDYLHDSLAGAGFRAHVDEYRAGTSAYKNVIGVLEGKSTETLVIGTHYDSYGKSPCANATASGVATVLELARDLGAQPMHDRTIVIGLWGTGEQPHTGLDSQGAAVWLNKTLEEKELQIAEAVIVGSFGSFQTHAGSQNSSFPWYLMYPKVGDWVGMYAPFTDKDTVKTALRRWAATTDLPARGMAAPTWMPGIPAADQLPFLEAGIPTLTVSDTGPERDTVFRTRNDDPWHLDYTSMAMRVEALSKFVEQYTKSGV